jgi:hypothetical protein
MVRIALMVLLIVGLAAPVAGQGTCSSMEECPGLVVRNAGAQRELATAGANALLGGATAALMRVVRGEPPWGAFWRGAIGGGMAYAGKRVAVEEFYGAGLVGREVASVGGSMVRNASLGRGLLEELVLPVGPVRLYVSGDGGVVPRVDLSTLIVSTAFMATYSARLDLRESVSAGALIFRGESPMPGLTSAGATVAWSDMPAAEGPRLLAHERVHILQYDQMFLTWGEQLERWAVRRTPLSEAVLNHVDLGLTAVGLRSGLALALDYHARPWESEAYFLAQRVYPVTAPH